VYGKIQKSLTKKDEQHWGTGLKGGRKKTKRELTKQRNEQVRLGEKVTTKGETSKPTDKTVDEKMT